MQTTQFLRVFSLSAALLTAMAGCAAKSVRRERLVPIPGAAYSLSGDAATVQTATLKLTVAPLDDAARAAYIRERTPAGADEFGRTQLRHGNRTSSSC